MSKVTVDLVRLIEQVMPQLLESIDPLLLQQWLDADTNVKQPGKLNPVIGSVAAEVQTTVRTSPDLQLRIRDVITFGDDSELRIHVLAPRGSGEDLATAAYYGLLAAISHIQANTNDPNLTRKE